MPNGRLMRKTTAKNIIGVAALGLLIVLSACARQTTQAAACKAVRDQKNAWVDAEFEATKRRLTVAIADIPGGLGPLQAGIRLHENGRILQREFNQKAYQECLFRGES